MFSLSTDGWLQTVKKTPPLVFKPLPTQTDLDSQVSCHLNRTPHSYLRRIFPKESCLFFPFRFWTLCRRSVYSTLLSAQSYPYHWLPGNPASQKAIPRAFVQTHTGGARLGEAERRWHLHPKWLQISVSDTTHLFLTQLIINEPRAFPPHLLLLFVLYRVNDASSLDKQIDLVYNFQSKKLIST